MSTKTLEVSSTLQSVVDSTLSPVGHTFLPANTIRELLTAYPNAVQVDVATRDNHGNVAVRATEVGLSLAFGAPEEVHVQPQLKSKFRIEEGFPIPAPRRGIQAEPRYLFTLLNVGQSFFVPSTPERPTPAKALASTVSSANKRMAKIGKKFIIRPVEGGARIWRIE